MTCQHIRLVRPKDIRIGSYRSGVIVPFLFRAKGSHVIPDTHDLFLSQSVELREKHNRLISMPFQKSVRVIFPAERVFDNCAVQSDTLPLWSVLVNFAEIVEHSHEIGRAAILPFQLTTFSQTNQVFCHREGVIEKTTFIIPVILGGGRGVEKAVFRKPVNHVDRNQRASVREFHEIQKDIEPLIVSHDRHLPRTRAGERFSRSQTLPGISSAASQHLPQKCHPSFSRLQKP